MINTVSLKKWTLSKNKSTINSFCKENSSEETTENLENKEESKKDIFFFFKETVSELNMIEWPSLDRLFKQFVIVVISLVFSAIFIYSVDGIFASMSKFLFEGN